MSDILQAPDLSGIPDECASEVLRQAETMLAATLQAGLAADQRANVRAGIYGTAAAGLLAAGLTLASAQNPFWSAVYATMTMAVLVFVAAVITGLSARPTDFHFPGYEPSKSAVGATTMAWLQKSIAEQTEMSIAFNRRCLNKNARLFNLGSMIAAAALPIGALTFFATKLSL